MAGRAVRRRVRAYTQIAFGGYTYRVRNEGMQELINRINTRNTREAMSDLDRHNAIVRLIEDRNTEIMRDDGQLIRRSEYSIKSEFARMYDRENRPAQPTMAARPQRARVPRRVGREPAAKAGPGEARRGETTRTRRIVQAQIRDGAGRRYEVEIPVSNQRLQMAMRTFTRRLEDSPGLRRRFERDAENMARTEPDVYASVDDARNRLRLERAIPGNVSPLLTDPSVQVYELITRGEEIERIRVSLRTLRRRGLIPE